MKNKILFLLCLLIIPYFAFADTVEIASMTAHYSHPVSNIVEDSGNNEALGQGMSESVLDPQALIETDSSGIYATLRLHMSDQIESYKFSVQTKGDSNFVNASAKEMKRQGDSVDFRLKLPSKNSIIRIEAYVTAMGRAVVFYALVGDTVEGNTDFIVSVNPNAKEAPAKNNIQNVQSSKNDEQITQNNTQVSKNETPVQNMNQIAEENAANVEPITVSQESNEANSNVSELTLDEFHGLIMKGDPRLGDGNKEKIHDEEVKQEEKYEYGSITISAITSLFVVIGTVSLFVFLSGIFVMVYYFFLRRTNDLREAEIYGFKKK